MPVIKESQAISDLVKAAGDIIDAFGNMKGKQARSRLNKGSLTSSSILKASKDLTMSFPVIVPDSIEGETAMMIGKAVERTALTTLQMLFAAAYMSGEDGREIISRYHKNMDASFDMDDYIDLMDSLPDTFADIDRIASESVYYDEAQEKLRQMFIESYQHIASKSIFNESSISDFVVDKNRNDDSKIDVRRQVFSEVEYIRRHFDADGNEYDVVRIGTEDDGTPIDTYYAVDNPADAHPLKDYNFQAIVDRNRETERHNRAEEDLNRLKNDFDREKFDYQVDKDYQDREDKNYQFNIQSDQREREISQKDRALRQQYDFEQRRRGESLRDYNLRMKQFQADQKKAQRDYKLKSKEFKYKKKQDILNRQQSNMQNYYRDYHKNQFIDSDIKKANEMVPSMMIIRYFINGDENSTYQEFIAGVKSRLIACPMEEIEANVKSAVKQKVSLLNLMKATTGETKFWKDFVFAIDQAKIDAKTNTRLSKTSPIWRSLQYRSNKSVINRLRRAPSNNAAAITTLCVTQDMVNRFKNMDRIDLEKPNVAKEVMTNFNLMIFIIIDEETEMVKILLDGEKYYQEYAFSALERETNDSSYKKVINLMSRMNR